jgi:DoxX-like family
MQADKQAPPGSKRILWAGRVITALAALFLIFDSMGHLMKPAPVIAAFAQLGFPLKLAADLAIIGFFCLVLYLIPRTAVLGAILLTGYLGGAVAINLRVGNPMFETTFPVIFGVLIWAGVFLREDRVRALVPLRIQGTSQPED